MNELNVREALAASLALLSRPGGWQQKRQWDPVPGLPAVQVGREQIGHDTCFCVLGALRVMRNWAVISEETRGEAERLLAAAVPIAFPEIQGAQWISQENRGAVVALANDLPFTTQEKVQRWLALALKES